MFQVARIQLSSTSCKFIVVKKDLLVRIHSCNNCGLVMDRNLNAAHNIRKKYIRLVWNSLIKENKKPAEISTYTHRKDMQAGTMSRNPRP